MRVPRIARMVAGLLAVTVAAGCESARLPLSAGTGPNPTLPEPNETLIPTLHIAPAKGWPEGGKPVAAAGTSVAAFASGLDHPRWIYVLPNGDVLVAESNAPPKGDAPQGIKDRIMTVVKKRAGSGVPSANRITLLRDADGDGVPETRTVFLEGLNSPFGMALIGSDFYVANTDAVVKFPYAEGATRLAGPGARVVDLPAGAPNRHWTRNLIASRDGAKLYVTVGSNSNVAEKGMDREVGRAAIWEVDRATGSYRVFAFGLRNPVGLAWEPSGQTLWTVVNERDELGSDLVPDYLTSVQDGAFYGWPYSYYGANVDKRVQPPRPDLVAKAIKPDYGLSSHVAPLGLAFAPASWPANYAKGAFIGEHGSWDRNVLNGYEVSFVPFAGGKPSGPKQHFLTGFVKDGKARGRPVGVGFGPDNALYVADDVGNVVWRIAPAAAPRT